MHRLKIDTWLSDEDYNRLKAMTDSYNEWARQNAQGEPLSPDEYATATLSQWVRAALKEQERVEKILQEAKPAESILGAL